jgi:hypothetical protein
MLKVYRSAMGESNPMYALYEESGKFQTGRVLSEAEASAQIELDSGKRVKVKSVQLLMKFDKPAPAEFMLAGQEVARGMEVEMAWEFTSSTSLHAMNLPNMTNLSKITSVHTKCWFRFADTLGGSPDGSMEGAGSACVEQREVTGGRETLS